MTSLLGFKQSTKARRGFSVILQIDLESIAIYIGEVKGLSKAAKNVYAQIMDAVDLLCEMPDLGKQFGDSALEVRGYRTYLAGNYRIFYAHDEETLIIWRIIHVRQDIDDYGLVEMWFNSSSVVVCFFKRTFR